MRILVDFMDKSKVYSTHSYDGKKEVYFDEEQAILQLLTEEILFSNYRTHSSDDKKLTNDGKTIVLFLNCNDVFAWACADAEDVSSIEELKSLYDYCEKYGAWQGSTIWVCMKRNQKPQRSLEKMLKDNNAWPIEVEKLQENKYDKFLKDANIKGYT
jgi:hypothetical protein